MPITHVCLFSDEGVIERLEAEKDAFELDIPAMLQRMPDFKFFTIYSGNAILFSAQVRK